MQTTANSQTPRIPIRVLYAFAFVFVSASFVILLILEFQSQLAVGSPSRIESKSPSDEALINTQPHYPGWNDSTHRAEPKHVEQTQRSVLRHQDVYVWTNRQRLKKRQGIPTFGKQLGPLTLGKAHTEVGDGYQSGKLIDIRIDSLEIHENPDDLEALFPNPTANDKPVLVFVHGFYVEFEEAIQRVTQIVHELEFEGHVFLYTWPSVFKLTLQGYVEDQQAIEASVNSCGQFLLSIVDHFGAENIQVLAHSLGCRLIAKTFQSLHDEGVVGNDPLVQNLIFAAPDIEMNKSQQNYLSALTAAAQRVSIYFSSNDATLTLAEKLDGRPPRLGRQGLPRFSHPFIELIDYSPLPGGFLNAKTHNLYREHPVVVQDIQGVLSSEISLSDRSLQDAPKH